MFKCKKCNSTDVEEKAWVKLNTPISEATVAFMESGDREDYWCNDCQEHREMNWEDE